MINVNQITAQLARMPDQALQQFAAMHKNDPYTVSLALSESNRRKQMRTAAQMPQGGEPPKVVDQGIAEMAPMPEDVGIGALPAGDMNFAEGGIVAFAGEGPSLVQDMSPEAINERYRQAQLKQLRDFFGITGVTRGSQSGMAAAGKPEARVAPPVSSAYPSETMRGAAATPVVAARPVAAPKPAPAAEGITKLLAPRQPRAAGAGPTASAAPAKAQDYMSLLNEAEANAKPVVDPLAEKRTAVTQKAIAAEEADLAALKKEQQERGDLFKGKEDRISRREAELGKEKGKLEGLSFIEAGLAMMQSKGRGLAGIAQGAGVGVKAYGAGIDKIKSAQEKLDEARDRMEELRQNQSMMDKKEVRLAEKGIRQLGVQGERDLLDGVAQATGEQKKDIRTAIASNMAVAEADKTRATQLQAAGIAAAPALARNKMLAASQGEQEKVRKLYTDLQTKVMAELSKDPTFQSATPAEQNAMQATRLRTALMNNPFLASYASGIGFSAAPTAGTVRTLDED